MEELTIFYNQACNLLEETQNKIELVQEWAEATKQKGASAIIEDCMKSVTMAYLSLYQAKKTYQKVTKTLEDIKKEDSQAFLESLGVYPMNGDTEELSIRQYLTDIISPYSDHSEEMKELAVGSYLYEVVKSDLQRLNYGQASVVARFIPSEVKRWKN